MSEKDIKKEYQDKLSTIRSGLYISGKDDEELDKAVKIVEDAKKVKAEKLDKLAKTNGSRNRAAGHKLETDTVKRLKEIGYSNICTTRNNSRVRDAEKVDVMFKDEAKHGRFPYNIQCKNVSKSLDYAKLLEELPKDSGAVNVIFHKQTKKAENGRFMKVGEYAILKLDDFYDILKRMLDLEDEAKSWSNIM